MTNETTNQEIENEVVEIAEETEAAEMSVTTEPEAVEASETTASTRIGTVMPAKLNIRITPFRAAKIIAVVAKGDKLTIDAIHSNEKWYCVTTKDGVQGYCMKKFVMVLK